MLICLPAEVRDRMVRHAVSSLPSEAVGLLAGRKNNVLMALPLRNIVSEGAFLADPYDQFKAEQEISSKALAILAIYHSHPDGCACLSDRDCKFGKDWQCAHIVVSLDTIARRARLRGYMLSSRKPAEIDLRYIDKNENAEASDSIFSW